MNAITNVTWNQQPSSSLTIADVLFPLFKNSIVVIRFYKIGYLLTLLLGFISCILSLLTFLRSTFRRLSIGCLFIALIISNIFYLIICIFDFVEFGLQIRFWRRIPYDELCRFRMFIVNLSQFATAWFLVFICIDQWIQTRFSLQAHRFCQRKKVFILISILILIDIALHAHILTQRFGTLIAQFPIAACGPYITEESYFSFYFDKWIMIQIILSLIIPVGLMLIILTDIIIYNKRQRISIEPNLNFILRRNANLHKQLFILSTMTVALLLLTSIPISIYRIKMKVKTNILQFLTEPIDIWTGLTWFQTLNYAMNFYLYLFSSTLFRKQFQNLFKKIKFFV